METSLLQQFIELLSLANLAQSLLALALAWVLLRGVRAALGYLTERFPRYRLQLGQSFPFIRVLVWSAVAGYIVFAILGPPQSVLFATLGSIGLAVGLAASAFIRLPEADPAAPAADAGSEPISLTSSQAVKTREFWCLWLTWVLAGAAGASMLVLATGFGLARGLSLTRAVLLLTSFNLTNGGGRLVSGFFSDRLGRSRTMAISFTCAAVAYLIMPHLEDMWVWTTLSAVIGFAFGTLFAVTAPLAGGAVKKIIKRGDGVDLMTQLDMEANYNSILLRSEDFQEGLSAMMEKRAARWKKR